VARSWQIKDLPLAIELWGDPAVTALIDSRGKLSDAQVEEKLCAEIERERSHGVQYWALFDHEQEVPSWPCQPSSEASIARPVVVRSTAPAPSNRLASASIASPKVLTRSSSANRTRRILGSGFCCVAAAGRLMIGRSL
jgi:hypothetical protein